MKRALAEQGGQCEATLHATRNVGEPVEVRVAGHRVGFLHDGDGTRFQRRLAYESRPGQTSVCGARIAPQDAEARGDRVVYTIWLDLKPFRH
ncbi:hypothetical protein [Pseudorhodoferax sp.]|uniref:hypothetical protein n=1 Tax=Pseudorhodoferax sp. TaxID=1993553 RepID=UPI0039E72A27